REPLAHPRPAISRHLPDSGRPADCHRRENWRSEGCVSVRVGCSKAANGQADALHRQCPKLRAGDATLRSRSASTQETRNWGCYPGVAPDSEVVGATGFEPATPKGHLLRLSATFCKTEPQSG